MSSKVLYYLLIVILGLLAVAGLVGFYYVAFGNLVSFLPEPIRQILPQPGGGSPTPPAPVSTGPQVSLFTDSSGRLIFSWKNLPPDIRDIHILRAREGQPRWSLWKTISVSNLSEGFIQLQSSFSQNLLAYTYYFEGFGGGTEHLWTSSSTMIGTGGSSAGSASSGNSPNPPSSGQSGGQTSPPPGSGSSGSPHNLPTNASSSTSTPNVETFYTPQGNISGSVPLNNDQPFWVKEINKKIQIGWSHLDPSSVRAVVSRASSEGGPWTVLFEQSDPVTNEPYTVFILDDAVARTAFYKLETFSASGATLDTYGPVVFHPAGS